MKEYAFSGGFSFTNKRTKKSFLPKDENFYADNIY